MKQTERVLRHLRDHGSLTSLEAVTEYGILRLAARISDLKKQGYKITSSFETGKNRYQEPVSYAVYRLAQ